MTCPYGSSARHRKRPESATDERRSQSNAPPPLWLLCISQTGFKSRKLFLYLHPWPSSSNPNPNSLVRTAMEEEIQKNRSSTIRFLGFLKQPDSESSDFELDESDVVWSGDYSDSINSSDSSPNSTQLSPVTALPALSAVKRSQHSFRPEKFGLSAALADERRSLVQRKGAFNPSLSAASAARTIPPVPVPRSVSGSDDFCGSSGIYHQSAPVNVPLWSKVNQGSISPAKLGFFNEDDEELEEEMLPPHEIVARSHMTTFSVFEGVGRTLKGRDLRRVRNAIWQKTGFLD